MIFDFNPWRLDVDVKSTEQLYKENDYSVDKAANIEFIGSLLPEQQKFFDSLGVDLSKAEINKNIYDISEGGELPASKIYKMSVNFLIKGKILALPRYQKDIYSDEEVFGKDFPDYIKIQSSSGDDYIKTFDNGIGMGVVFKHPCLYYNDRKFKEWECGYILGSILIMRDL